MLPVATREVREAARRPRTHAWRWGTAGVGLAVLAMVAWATRGSRTQGHEMFVGLSVAAYIYALVAGAVRTADSIAEEKRENTLGLLFLTDLKGWDILSGKLISTSVNCFSGLLALLPLLAIPMIMGGVPWDEFLRVALNLVNTLFLSISWGFVISAVFRSSAVTVSLALGTAFLFGVGLPILSVYLIEELKLRGAGSALFFLTPTHSQLFAHGNPGPGAPTNHYWLSLGTHHLMAWLYLWAAIHFLPRFWQDVPKSGRAERWREKLRGWRFGEGRTKAQFRTRLLGQSPLYWLANRERVSSPGLMLGMLGVMAGAAAFGVVNPGVDVAVATWLGGLAIAHGMLAFRMAMAASNRLGEDRRSGALELLLGTELSIQEILRGHWMALRRQFFGPVMMVVFCGLVGAALLLLSASLDMRVGNMIESLVEMFARMWRPGARAEHGWMFLIYLSILAMLALNWAGLVWVGMWLGLRERRAGFALWPTLALALAPPWMILIGGWAMAEEAGVINPLQPDTTLAVALASGWALGLGHWFLVVRWARRNLRESFREAAADRFLAPRRFPWRAARTFGLRAAGVAAAVCALFLIFRAVVDRKGEKVWQAALARHPEFSVSRPPDAPRIPAEKNLAKAPIFLEWQKPGREIEWSLERMVGRNSSPPRLWEGRMGRLANLARVESLYLERKNLAEAKETPGASVLSGLGRVEWELERLHAEARTRPLLQFGPWNRSPGTVYNPWVGRESRNSQTELGMVLALRASARLAEGEHPMDDVLLGLRLARGLAEVPGNLQQFVGMAMTMAQPVYDGLCDRRWSEGELEALQKEFAGLDFWSGYDAFRADQLRDAIEWVETGSNPYLGRRKKSWLARQMPVGFKRERAAALVGWAYEDSAGVVDVKARRIDAEALRRFARIKPEFEVPRGLPNKMPPIIRAVGFGQTVADQVVVACALERFRIRRGVYPERLEELAPEFLAEVPKDVFTGEALKYRLGPGKTDYVIYGVGHDGVDDGGTPVAISSVWSFWNDPPGSDWVWKSAAEEFPRPAAVRK